MTTATIISFPSITLPPKITWTIERMDGGFTSPLSGQIQQIVRPGARWRATLAWSTLSEDDWHALSAWGAQMTQGNVRCALPNYAYRARGSLAGTPKVNGAGQTGATLATKGWTASASNVLKVGDMFQITDGTKHQLVMVTANVSADGLGDASVPIVPALRISPTDSSVLVTSSPAAYFMFPKGSSSLSFTPPYLAAASHDILEDILL